MIRFCVLFVFIWLLLVRTVGILDHNIPVGLLFLAGCLVVTGLWRLVRRRVHPAWADGFDYAVIGLMIAVTESIR